MDGIQTRRVQTLCAIVERGKGQALIEQLSSWSMGYQLRFTGHGTASTEMMDILGLGSTEKDVVISMGTSDAVSEAVRYFSENLSTTRYRGIMMLFSPDAVSRLLAVILTMKKSEDPERKESVVMKNEHQHSLIMIVVNQGYTDQVMQIARRSGATGGTVIRARLADADKESQFHGITLQEEKEIVAILAPDSIRDQLMEDVNRECGFRSEAQGVLCSVPVDKAFKI